nr:TetR-like C-terminal domain-containing protein [uncultured Oscillibacter sp.]
MRAHLSFEEPCFTIWPVDSDCPDWKYPGSKHAKESILEGRTYFYRNYAEREDIGKAYVEHLFQDWVDRWKETPDLPVREVVRIVFSHFEANREFYTMLNERGLVYLLKDIILNLCGFNPEQEMFSAHSSAYVAFFLYGCIEVWLRRGMRDTTEELIAYLPQ